MVYKGAFSSSFKSNLLKVLFRLHKKKFKNQNPKQLCVFFGEKGDKKRQRNDDDAEQK